MQLGCQLVLELSFMLPSANSGTTWWSLPLQPQINEAAAITRAASLTESVKNKKEREKRPDHMGPFI